jgi:elongation factor Ts
MTNYTAQEIKKLRDATGAGFLDCKNALDEAEGDYEKARQLLESGTEPQRRLEEEIKSRKNETAAKRKIQYIEHQKASKIASVELEIEMLKREISEIKKAHNALIASLERAAANEKSSSKNSRVQPVVYGTYFIGDFSG